MFDSNSILDSVKKQLGIDSDYDCFDPDIILSINNAFGTLNQIGVGPEEGFSIEDRDSKWDSYDGNTSRISMIKQYVCLKAKMSFDPPASATIAESYNSAIRELEWRLHVAGGNY